MVSIRLKMTQRQRRHQLWDMLYDLVDLADKLWFYELYT